MQTFAYSERVCEHVTNMSIVLFSVTDKQIIDLFDILTRLFGIDTDIFIAYPVGTLMNM